MNINQIKLKNQTKQLINFLHNTNDKSNVYCCEELQELNLVSNPINFSRTAKRLPKEYRIKLNASYKGKTRERWLIGLPEAIERLRNEY